MQKKIALVICNLMLCVVSLKANQPDTLKAVDSMPAMKITSVSDFMKKGSFNGHLRTYAMGTFNKGKLRDYHAWAYGLGLGYESPVWNHLYAGMSGFLIFDISSSNFLVHDSITGAGSRYESGLYNVEHFDHKSGLAHVETMYLGFKNKYVNAKFGKQELNTPLVNLQDSRMAPNHASGLYFESKINNKLHAEGGWITHFSPRSTIEWYHISHTIGIYPAGVNESGERSTYKNNLQTAGLGILGLSYHLPKIKIQAWDYFADNIFNTFLGQADVTLPINHSANSLRFGAQVLRQNAIAHGGNIDPGKAYITPGSKSGLYGATAGYGNNKWLLSFNYLHITDEGRFLMPREWGKEQLYVTLPRERLEGAGNVKAANVKLQYNIKRYKLKAETAYGYYKMPDVHDFRLNKYGLPSYDHFYFSLLKQFSGMLKNTDARFIYVYKGQHGEDYGDAKYVINKVGMHHLDLIINYHF